MIPQAKTVTAMTKSTRRTRVNYYCLLWRCAIRSNSSFVNRAILEPRVLLPPPTPLSLIFRTTLVFFVDPVTVTKPISYSNPFSGIPPVRGWLIRRYSHLCQSSAWPNDPIPKYVRRSQFLSAVHRSHRLTPIPHPSPVTTTQTYYYFILNFIGKGSNIRNSLSIHISINPGWLDEPLRPRVKLDSKTLVSQFIRPIISIHNTFLHMLNIQHRSSFYL